MDGGRKEICQCQSCGDLHREDLKEHKVLDDIFIRMKCKKCGNITSHLLCGTEDIDIYSAYNLNVDPRYYTTK